MRLPPSDLSVGDRLARDEIERLFDTGLDFTASGINPRRDTDGRQYVLVFAGADGPYDDGVTSGRFEYIGGRSVLADADAAGTGEYSLVEAADSETDIPVFFFYRGADQHRWTYQGRVAVRRYRLDGRHGRQTPVFVLEHVDDTTAEPDSAATAASEAWLDGLRALLARYREERRTRTVTARTLARFGGDDLAAARPAGSDLRQAVARGLAELADADAVARIDDDTYRIRLHEEIDAERDRLVERLETEPPLTETQGVTDHERRVRSRAFTEAVREAYDDACAVCGRHRETPDGNPEVEAAHIYPKRESGTDDVRNGLALCRLHHWAFDGGWLAVDDEYHVLVRDAPDSAGYEEFRALAGDRLLVPDDADRRPHGKFLRAHRTLHGFEPT